MIMQHVDRRVQRRTVKRELAKIRQEMAAERQAERRYDGGLALELASLERIRSLRRSNAKSLRRQILISRVGRRIDLAALLDLRHPDGTPAWTVVDPTVGGSARQYFGRDYDSEGARNSSGIRIGGSYRKIGKQYQPSNSNSGLVPRGMPALPETIRKLATDKNIRRRAKWVGVLYQPEEWMEVEPDPALVVEWKDLPGEYYALAVWGYDGPRIMEFVD